MLLALTKASEPGNDHCCVVMASTQRTPVGGGGPPPPKPGNQAYGAIDRRFPSTLSQRVGVMQVRGKSNVPRKTRHKTYHSVTGEQPIAGIRPPISKHDRLNKIAIQGTTYMQAVEY